MTFAGNTVGVGPLAAATHVWTQEHFDGPSDAFLVIVSGSASNAIAFDDDDGIGLQSWLHLAPSCSSCSIVFGRFNAG
ncbi:MAG TPA: hypothetical protein VG963_24390, partial [Polyangiaceae bacterium]|nr:hypothetical protein [Polyangiaceae bacterium]